MTDPTAPRHAGSASLSLDGTLNALDGGPTGLTPSAALALVDHWQAACAAAGLAPIADGLARLRRSLQGRLDGAVIAATLADLAEATLAAADAGDEAIAPGLVRLAATLNRFASVLG